MAVPVMVFMTVFVMMLMALAIMVFVTVFVVMFIAVAIMVLVTATVTISTFITATMVEAINKINLIS